MLRHEQLCLPDTNTHPREMSYLPENYASVLYLSRTAKDGHLFFVDETFKNSAFQDLSCFSLRETPRMILADAHTQSSSIGCLSAKTKWEQKSKSIVDHEHRTALNGINTKPKLKGYSQALWWKLLSFKCCFPEWKAAPHYSAPIREH